MFLSGGWERQCKIYITIKFISDINLYLLYLLYPFTEKAKAKIFSWNNLFINLYIKYFHIF
jgi:hypothetical protein